MSDVKSAEALEPTESAADDPHARKTDPAPALEAEFKRDEETDLKTVLTNLVKSMRPKVVSEVVAEVKQLLREHENQERSSLEKKLKEHHDLLAQTNRAAFREEVFAGFNPFLERFEEWQKTQALRIDSLERHSSEHNSRLNNLESLRETVETLRATVERAQSGVDRAQSEVDNMKSELETVKRRLAALESIAGAPTTV